MEQRQQQMPDMNSGGMPNNNHANSIRNAQQVLNSSAIEDLVDELS